MAQDKGIVGRRFIAFEQERLMSLWENQVEYNLSESGVDPLTIHELVEDPQHIEELLETKLSYPQSNGSLELRERVASLYPDASPDNVLITTGCAQANFMPFMALTEPSDKIAVMIPSYMQVWGLAQNLRCDVSTFSLGEDSGWCLDRASLEDSVKERTKLIYVVNPNNPTGHILSKEEINALISIASKAGSWILSDEVYAGSERLTDQVTPSLWNLYERVLVTNSMSKAYALPGLRIGWIVGPAEIVKQLWAWQDYINISSTMLGNVLAAITLSPGVRDHILQRTKRYIRRGYRILEDWIDQHPDLFSLTPPQATAVAFVRYHRTINSTQLVHKLIDKDTFAVPGDVFGFDHYLRISFGLPEEYLREGLTRLAEVTAAAA
jgi:aspartate/methionine/tyrosine aminotransferase